MCLWGGQGFAIGKQFLGCLIEPPRGKHLKTSEHTGSARGEVSKFKPRCPPTTVPLGRYGYTKISAYCQIVPSGSIAIDSCLLSPTHLTLCPFFSDHSRTLVRMF